jgi:autotransporter-associated beta strand protein
MQAASASASGPITVNISAQSGQLGIGTITLLQYSGTFGGGGSFVLGNLSGLSGQLVHNAGLLQLVINGVEKFTWEGKNGTSWDFGTGNWLSGITGTGSIFKNGYLTEFNDSGTTGTVDIQTDVAPSPLVVNNNELPYVFTGGSITTPLLTKTGTSSLTRVLGSANDFINEIALNEGSLILETTENKSFANPLTGTGTLVKSGSSELTMATPIPDFDGNIQILSGIYKFGTDSPLGSTNGSTTIASGATLDVNGINSPHEPVFVSGDGVGGQGAIINSGPGGVQNNLVNVTLLGHTTFGSSSRWDLRMRAGTGVAPGLKGNGYNLTKVGSGSTSIAAQRHNYGTNEFGLPVPVPYWDMNLGDVYINEGTLTFAESLTPGNPAKTINIAPGAIMSTFDLGLTNPIVRNMFVNGGQIQSGGGSRDTNVWTGTINVTGSLRLQVNSDTRMFINGPIVGDGSVSYFDNVGNGFLALNAVNTFSGDLSVENGTLVGGGSIAGNLVMIAGTNSPGMSADLTTGMGNFTVGGNATLAGTTKMELAPGQTPNSDKLTVNGTPTWGGHLQVVLAPGAALPGPGDTFVLFNKVGSGSFASKSLPALRAGLTWNDKIAVDGTLSVAGTLANPVITDVHLEGTNLILSGTGGVDGMSYNVITSTNVAAPINQWTTAATAVFGPGGTFSFTNSATGEKMFYRVRIP